VDGGLDVLKYHHRWYHHQTFDSLLPKSAGLFESNRSVQWCSQVCIPVLGPEHYKQSSRWFRYEDKPDLCAMDSVQEENESDLEDKNSTQIQIAPVGDKETFHHMQEKSTALARADFKTIR
jgi:hypothetical protein